MSLTKEQIEFLQWKAKGEHPFTKLEIESQDIRDLCDMALRSLEADASAIGTRQDVSAMRKVLDEIDEDHNVTTINKLARYRVQAHIMLRELAAAPVAAPTGQILRAGDVKPPQAIVNALGQPVAATGAQEAVGYVSQLHLDWITKNREQPIVSAQIFAGAIGDATMPLYAAPQPVASAPEEKTSLEPKVQTHLQIHPGLASMAWDLVDVPPSNWTTAQTTAMHGFVLLHAANLVMPPKALNEPPMNSGTVK